MSNRKIKEIIVSIGLIAFSSLIGIRIVNEYLKYNDQPKYKYSSSKRVMNDGSELHVAHRKNYDIQTTGEDTVVIIGDSFGEGAKCGNYSNIAGCLSRLNPKNKIVNLSLGGTSPAFYLKQMKTYISNQRNSKKNISGEKIIVLLYSNDIILDPEYCKFYNSNKSKFQSVMNPHEFNKVNKKCDSLISLSIEEYYKTKKSIVPFREQIRTILGKYSFRFIRELSAKLTLKFSKNDSIGRARYIPIWNDNNFGEIILLVEVIKEMKNICNKNNCNLLITTFPNVENLSANSKVRLSLLKFSKFMNKKHNFKIYDGYEPFISKKIINASYSLTDIHSNCEGYQLFANWLVDLK